MQPEGSAASSVDGKWRGFCYAVLLVAIYSAAHIIARVFASDNLGEDDPVTNVLVQSLEVGYSVYQPPLFEWLNWALQQLTGPSLLGFQVVKYALLIATVAALYLAAFEVTRNVVWSVITAEALTLIYHVGWRFHEGFTGLIPAMLCSALALVFVLRIVRGGRLSDFVFLGFALGFGLLSEHTFMLGLLALFLAAGLVAGVRKKVFEPKLLLTIVVAALVVSPYYHWILADGTRVDQLINTHSIFTNPNPNHDVWKLVRKTAGAPVGFFWSLLLFLLFARRLVHLSVSSGRCCCSCCSLRGAAWLIISASDCCRKLAGMGGRCCNFSVGMRWCRTCCCSWQVCCFHMLATPITTCFRSCCQRWCCCSP